MFASSLYGASVFILMSYNYAQAYASRCFLIVKYASYWIMFSLVYSLLVQNALKNGKLKHNHMELFTVSGMLTHSKWSLQRCEGSMHNCTLFIFHKALLSLHKALFTPYYNCTLWKISTHLPFDPSMQFFKKITVNTTGILFYSTLHGRIKRTKSALLSLKCKGAVWKHSYEVNLL